MKIEKRWIISFALVTILAVLSLFWENSNNLASEFTTEAEINHADVAWLLTSSSFVLLMTPGLSFFYGGMVGKKNVISTMLQSFISLGVVSLLWVVVGFSLSFGRPIGFEIDETFYGIIGNPFDFLFFNNVSSLPHKTLAGTIPFILFALF